ncbi:MAG: flagellar basal body-associated protein FliL [bacterium]
MAEEEVLGEEEELQEEEGEEQEGGGMLDFTGGLMDSFVVKILMGAIALVAVVLLVVFVTYWTTNTLWMGTQPGKEQEVAEEQPGALQHNPYQTYSFENDFIITKQDPRTGRTRTLKVAIVLAFNDENAAVKGELKKRKAQIRDLIYGLLGQMNIEQLGYSNKQKIQDKLVSEINKKLTSGNRIQDIYFSNYVFQ